MRNYCRRRGRPFTTSYTTRFPEYISARSPIPEAWIYAILRWFHGAASVTMVATPSLRSELGERGFRNLGMWTRGVDVDLFRPDRAIDLDFPRPIFMTVGRVAVEKNLEAFLSLDLPGSKVVIGDGPQLEKLRRDFPEANFLGPLENGTLAAHLAAADVFVFPSRTDTFGIVQLEALASGVPVAAYPVTGPRDVIGDHPIGALHAELDVACLRGVARLARCVPQIRIELFMGKQRPAIPRPRPQGGRRQPRSGAGDADHRDRFRLRRRDQLSLFARNERITHDQSHAR